MNSIWILYVAVSVGPTSPNVRYTARIGTYPTHKACLVAASQAYDNAKAKIPNVDFADGTAGTTSELYQDAICVEGFSTGY